MPEDYAAMELGRQAREIERLREELRNPSPPMVPLSLFEEVRKTQGERIGQLEEDLRAARARIQTAILSPIAVALVVAVLLQAMKH